MIDIDIILQISKIIVISFVLKDLFVFIGDILSELVFKRKWMNIINSLIVYIMSCEKCSSFWISIILSGGNLLVSSIVSLLVMLLHKWTYKYLNETEI